MRVAFVANRYFDPSRLNSWSGLPFFIRRSLERAGVEVETCVLSEPNPAGAALRYAYWRFLRGRRYARGCEARVLLHYSRELGERLRGMEVDAVFCPSSWPIAYLEGGLPTVFWTDACFAGMVNFYESFTNLARNSLVDGHAAERSALRNCARAIYSSAWAASTACESYGADPSKIRIVPFGGNVLAKPRLDEIGAIVARRQAGACNLLLIGVDWERKGAGTAVEAVRILNSQGLASRLTIVGCAPPGPAALPPSVEVIPFIDKETDAGRRRFSEVCMRSHFLIMPSLADCTPVAIVEGNYFGLPCLASDVGGIPSLVTNEVNGHLFRRGAGGEAYAEHIYRLMCNPERYRSFAECSAADADRRFSWVASGARVASILAETVALGRGAGPHALAVEAAGK